MADRGRAKAAATAVEVRVETEVREERGGWEDVGAAMGMAVEATS